MATGKAYRFLSADHQIAPSPHHDSSFELDESDVYGPPISGSPDFRRSSSSSQATRKPAKRGDAGGRTAAPPSSLPVNVPDWAKILRGEYRGGGGRRRDSFDDDSDSDFEGGGGGGGDGMWMPPHEFLARTRMASFSVHEGRGRTLKGRDLSRVRNAIWEKTGFED